LVWRGRGVMWAAGVIGGLWGAWASSIVGCGVAGRRNLKRW